MLGFYWTYFTLPEYTLSYIKPYNITGVPEIPGTTHLAVKDYRDLLKTWDTLDASIKWTIRSTNGDDLLYTQKMIEEKEKKPSGIYNQDNVITLMMSPDTEFGKEDELINSDVQLLITADKTKNDGSWDYKIEKLSLAEIDKRTGCKTVKPKDG